MRAFAPQIMRQLESRYTAQIKNKGGVVDITPEKRGDNKIQIAESKNEGKEESKVNAEKGEK